MEVTIHDVIKARNEAGVPIDPRPFDKFCLHFSQEKSKVVARIVAAITIARHCGVPPDQVFAPVRPGRKKA